MSNRLTHSARPDSLVWPLLAGLWLVVTTALAVLAQLPDGVPVIPEEAHRLYRQLPSPVWTVRMQAWVLGGLFLASGGLVRTLVTGKSSANARMLATVLGTALPAVLLHPLSGSALGPQPLYPAWLLALGSGLALLQTPDKPHPVRQGLSGLCAGLALSLDPIALPALLPTAVWVTAGTLLSPKRRGPGFALWLTGLAAGLIPVLTGTVPFAPGWTPGQGLPGLGALPPVLRDSLTGWSLPFLLLALLAAGLQLQTPLLAWMLPVGLLQALQAAHQTDLIDDTRFFLILPFTWLVAYGGFRLLKGLEQGVRHANTKAAKRILPLSTGLLLAGFTAWTISLFL